MLLSLGCCGCCASEECLIASPKSPIFISPATSKKMLLLFIVSMTDRKVRTKDKDEREREGEEKKEDKKGKVEEEREKKIIPRFEVTMDDALVVDVSHTLNYLSEYSPYLIMSHHFNLCIPLSPPSILPITSSLLLRYLIIIFVHVTKYLLTVLHLYI